MVYDMPKSPYFSFSTPEYDLERQFLVEHVDFDDPSSILYAKPLFANGLRQAAITKRTNVQPYLQSEIQKDRLVHSFTLLLNGHLQMQVGSELKTLSQGDLIYNPPFDPFRRIIRENESVWFLYIQLFDVPQWEPLTKKGAYCKKYEYADQMFLLLRRILDFKKEQKFPELAVDHALLLSSLLKHEVQGSFGSKESRAGTLSDLMEKMTLHPEYSWDVVKMAKELHISRVTLNRHFISHYGVPPKQMLIRLRLARAMELLRSTEETIDSIAWKVGYESTSAFSTLFKSNIGVRPGEFRNGNHQLEKHLKIDSVK